MHISKLKIYTPQKNIKYKSYIYQEKINPFLKLNPSILNNFDDKFIQYINKFLNTLEAKNPNIDLNLFYKNLIDLSIKEKKNFNRFKLFKTAINGMYNFKINQIEVLKNNYSFTIFHELLHCASTRKDGNVFLSGFYKKDKKSSMGRTLNEAYTNLLEERYFEDNFKSNAYDNIKHIVKTIELLIGKDKMEKLYFTGNLNDLIKEFEKFGANKQQILFFIDELDYIRYNLGFDENRYLCQKAIYHVTNFLISCFSKKDCSKLNEYIENFNFKIKANNITYNFLETKWNMHLKYEIDEYYIDEINCFKKYYIK